MNQSRGPIVESYEVATADGKTLTASDSQNADLALAFAAGEGTFSSGVYVNDLADEGAAGVRHAYYAETLPRLTACKDRYDPENLLHLNHNIPPSGSA